MKVLLDNCVPRRFGERLTGHSVVHAGRAGLGHLSNGELLSVAAAQAFDVMLTVDRKMTRQQNLGELPVPVLVLLSLRNTESALFPLVPAVLALLGQQLQRRVYTVG